MLVASTPIDRPQPKKKRKRPPSSTPSDLKTKKRKRQSCPVPELILCANELKSEVKQEVAVTSQIGCKTTVVTSQIGCKTTVVTSQIGCKTTVKQEVVEETKPLTVPAVEALQIGCNSDVVTSQIGCKTTVKQEIISPVRLGKKKKKKKDKEGNKLEKPVIKLDLTSPQKKKSKKKQKEESGLHDKKKKKMKGKIKSEMEDVISSSIISKTCLKSEHDPTLDLSDVRTLDLSDVRTDLDNTFEIKSENEILTSLLSMQETGETETKQTGETSPLETKQTGETSPLETKQTHETSPSETKQTHETSPSETKHYDLISENNCVVEGFIKQEPLTPEKSQIKIEPSNTEIQTLFNSNIKQELRGEDVIDVEIIKKLSYKGGDACIERYNTQLHCALPPAFLCNIQSGITTQLQTQRLKHVASLRGVLLKYTHIRYSHRTARILASSPELHFDISCTVTVFRPVLGAVLQGRVVRIGPGYVNCLVYGYFSAVVYDRFRVPVQLDSVVRFKVQFVQVSAHNDYILKGNPV